MKARRNILSVAGWPVHLVLIAIIGLLAYSNTYSVPFQFDDRQNIVENPLIKSVRYALQPSSYCSQIKVSNEQETVCNFFTRRYVGNLSFALNYALHGLDVSGYHAVNISIHVLNAILVYVLVLLTFRTTFLKHLSEGGAARGVAFIAGLLFVAHPLQTQSVTYIVQRFTSLATLFYLMSLVMYIQWRLERQTAEDRSQKTDGKIQTTEDRQKTNHLKTTFWYAVSLVSAVLAMKTKEIAFTLPFVIAVYDFLFFDDSFKGRIYTLTPIFFTLLIIPLGIVDIGKPLGSLIGEVSAGTRVHSVMSRWDYLLTQFTVVVTYIRLLFFPRGQNLDYDHPVYHSFSQGAVFLSFLLLVFLIGAGVYLCSRSRTGDRRLRLVAFGIFLFFFGLSVESSIIPIEDVIFEHRVYLSSIGAFIAIASAFHLIAERLRTQYQAAGRIFMPSIAFIVLILAGTTYARNSIWRDPVSLWEDVVSKSPHKARAHYNLGNAYKDQGDLLRAEREWELTVSVNPGHALALGQLGNIHYLRNSYDTARVYYERSLRLNNNDPVLCYNIALVSEKLHDMKGAASYYEMFVKKATPEYYYLVPQVSQKLAFLKSSAGAKR